MTAVIALNRRPITGMRAFLVMWAGQLVSVIGSAASSFALGVWVYQDTGSVTLFSVSLVCGYLPGMAAAVVAGVLVDRHNRRTVLLLCDAAAGAAMSVLVVAYAADVFSVWYVYGFQIVASLCVAVQWPAFAASLSQLVAPHRLGRAIGMSNVSQGSAELIGLLISGFLLTEMRLTGLFVFDLASYALSLASLAVITIPPVPRPEPSGPPDLTHPPIGEWQVGLRWLVARPGLLGMAVFSAVYNFVTAAVTVLVTPLVLAFASAATLGLVASVGGAGMVAGGVLMSIWGGPRRRRIAVLAGTSAIAGSTLVVAGTCPGVPVFAAVAFGYFLCLPVVTTCGQTILQLKTDPAVQGRVFAVRRMIAQAGVPVSYLLIGAVATHLNPRVRHWDGPFFGALGSSERGSALLLAGMGLVTVLAGVAAYAHPRIRRVDGEIPDARMTEE
jgi:MFS transporter, DHA3 family, macrolide efflux protein